MADPAQNLKTYLVGGAVRDQLLGIEVKDRDWVVVGSTPDDMTGLGFKPVGKDFPVFLHPESGEEYALARSERKTAQGYHGFEFNSSAETTLEEDLKRRDLTINAMAEDANGKLIDPYGGRNDLNNKILRHVSPAFKEDPVRVLRTARFAARFAVIDFFIADETKCMMKELVANGEVDALVPERVWQEMVSSFGETHCSVFFKELRNCGALKAILPELDVLFGIPQSEKYHPEIDTGVHILMSIDAITCLSNEPMLIFATLVHDLGKGLTPEPELPAHRGHEKRGLKPITQLCQRLGVPSGFRAFALKVCEFHLHCHRIHQLKPATVLKLLENFDGFRNPDLIEKFCLCCLADKRGRMGHEKASDEQMQLLQKYHIAALGVDGGMIAAEVKASCSDQENIGKAIKKSVQKHRLAAISRVKKANEYRN